MKFFNFRLQTKILLVSFGMLLLFGIAVLVQFEKAQNAQRKEVGKVFSMYSANLVGSLSQVFFNLYSNPQAFIKNRAFQEKKFADINFIFNELTSLFPVYDLMIYTDMEGNYIASNSIASDGKKLNIEELKKMKFDTTEWFKNTKSRKYKEDLKKQIFGSYVGKIELDPHVSKAHGKDRIGQHFSTLVENDSMEPVGVITTFASVSWAEAEISGLYEAMEKAGKSTANIALVDKDENVMVTYDPYNNKGKKEFVHDLEKSIFKAYTLPAGHVPEDYLSETQNISHIRFLDALGWKIKINVDKEDAFSGINASGKTFYATFIIMVLVCGIISYVVASKLSKKLMNVSNDLKMTAQKTEQSSQDLNRASNSVSQSSNDQASSIQTTASTLDEFSSMLQLSTKNAQQSLDFSIKSKEAADEGKEIVKKVVASINEIKQSNQGVLQKTTEGNHKIREIVALINEISEKTKVINDIVFQTKLLSFNASVEAARAGEHGKGFAVVAEEVGNLAVMSGNAAKEIFDMLNGSIVRVQTIVSQTQAEIEGMMKSSTVKIENGISIAGECDVALDKISINVESVNALVSEVVSAAKEQEIGVQQIAVAMGEIEKSTNFNSATSRETLEYSYGLTTQSKELLNIVSELESEIYGTKAIKHQDVVAEDSESDSIEEDQDMDINKIGA
ncbi:MAG: methyl-accepting chemotaxis protein [Bacteriovorax sp.]|nr:methyl-accepting chemotaxis protein [Bacteriovorax sp.]